MKIPACDVLRCANSTLRQVYSFVEIALLKGFVRERIPILQNCPHPLTPSPKIGEGEPDLKALSQSGRRLKACGIQEKGEGYKSGMHPLCASIPQESLRTIQIGSLQRQQRSRILEDGLDGRDRWFSVTLMCHRSTRTLFVFHGGWGLVWKQVGSIWYRWSFEVLAW